MGGQWKAGAVLAAAAVLTGCGSIGRIHHPDAFNAKKTYAVVSVMASEKVGCSEAGGNMCNGGVFGLFNMAAKTDAYSTASGEILERTYPTALRALRAPNLKIAPDVKAHKAYRAAAEDEQPKGAFSQPHAVAKGYKYLADDKKLVQLARDLKVDGVITVTLSYNAARSGVTVGGVGGGHKAQTMVTVRAIDKDGKNVWVDYAMGQSDESVSTGIGAVDFPKLRPLFVESTDKAVRKLMENFNSRTKTM
jgi:hypothetical protein